MGREKFACLGCEPPAGYCVSQAGRGRVGNGADSFRSTYREDPSMSRFFRLGGIAASIILIAVGIGAIVIGASGRSRGARHIVQRKDLRDPRHDPATP